MSLSCDGGCMTVAPTLVPLFPFPPHPPPPPPPHQPPHSIHHTTSTRLNTKHTQKSAGYFSYKWAEVMSADAFEAFEEAGLHDEASETPQRWHGMASRRPWSVGRFGHLKTHGFGGACMHTSITPARPSCVIVCPMRATRPACLPACHLGMVQIDTHGQPQRNEEAGNTNHFPPFPITKRGTRLVRR